MRVALQHLHALMAADGGNFLIRKSGLDKSAHGLMTQVMEAKILQTLLSLDRLPHPIKLVRPPLTIATWFTEEDQIRIFGRVGLLTASRNISTASMLNGTVRG